MTSISSAMSAALSGMMANERRATATASNIANAMTPGYDRLETKFTASGNGVKATVAPSGTSTLPDQSNVDLATEAMNLKESEISFKANASVWETGADMWDALASMVKD